MYAKPQQEKRFALLWRTEGRNFGLAMLLLKTRAILMDTSTTLEQVYSEF